MKLRKFGNTATSAGVWKNLSSPLAYAYTSEKPKVLRRLMEYISWITGQYELLQDQATKH